METKEYRLTDICDFQGGTQPPKEEWINEPRDGYVRMLQIRDFTQDKAEHIGYVKDNKKLNKCSKDDILIGRYGASVGKILTGLCGAYNVAIMKTIPNTKLLSKKYLYYILTGESFQNFILSIGARAAQAGFNKNDLSYFKLQIPTSIEEQDRISNVLELSNNLILRREKSIELCDTYLKMKFQSMFGNPVKNELNWEIINLENHCIKITDGTHKTPKYTESGIKFISAKNIKSNRINWENIKYISINEHNNLFKRCNPEYDDIVLTKSGSIGSAALVKVDFEFSMFESLALIKYKRDSFNNNFLLHLLNSDEIGNSYVSKTKGISIRHLHLIDIRSLLLPKPPIELQNKFSQIVEQVELLKELFTKSLNEFKELYNSLNRKALKGKLEIIENLKIELSDEFKFSEKLIITGHKALDKINKELETFHINQPHTGAPDEIDNKIKQLEAELKLRGEIPFWDEYVKYRLVIGKFNEAFTFEQLWDEISKFPFEKLPTYDRMADLLFVWLKEENPFIRQQYNENTKQIELFVNETAKA